MPGMDGMAFIRHLGESTSPVSLIVASALDRSLVASVEAMAREYGVNLLGALSKPVTRKKLAALIQLHRPSAASPAESHVVANFTVEEVLRALELDQIEPFFQAKVDLQTGLVTGAEALARWDHPLHGIIPPAAFI